MKILKKLLTTLLICTIIDLLLFRAFSSVG